MQLVRHQRIEVSMPPPAATSPGKAEVILSRAQRAHSRLSWAERLARNARAPTASRVTIRLFGATFGFATSLGEAEAYHGLGSLWLPSPRTRRLLRVEPHGLCSWLFLDFSHLLPFSPSIPLFLPSLMSSTFSSARLSPTRSGVSSSTASLRNSWTQLHLIAPEATDFSCS